MTQKTEQTTSLEVTAENIGGISETTVELVEGVNILTGRNATHRTSFLQAVMAALGSDEVSLKGDKDRGRARLDLGEETYEQELVRENTTVRFSGDPYVSDASKAELFAFLMEDNPARQAVRADADLRDIIMDPIDYDEIQREITELERERKSVDQQIESLEAEKERLPELETERHEVESRLEEIEAELTAKRDELESLNASVEDTKQRKDELDAKMEELQSARADLEDVTFQLDTAEQRVEANRDELEDLTEALDSLPETSAERVSELEAEIRRLREHKRSVESTINQIQQIVQFNEELLDGENAEILEMVKRQTTDDRSVTEDLVGGTTVCWTCGSEVPEERIQETVSQLKQLHQSQADNRKSLDSELQSLQKEKQQIQQKRQNRTRLEGKRSEIESDIESSERRIENLQDRKDELESKIESLESEIQSVESQDQTEVLAVHKDVNELEFESKQLKDRLEEIEASIAEIRESSEDIESLRETRDQLTETLGDLRTRVQTIEKEAIEEFNDHMELVLDLLEYDNLERIWIERREGQNGRTTGTSRSEFRLHVVRKTEEGTVYEDTIDHLSESEREVVGLVFALAGYLVHDVNETVPFMLLDSVEAVDSDRIAKLVDYFKKYTEVLVIALLPEDASALSEDYYRVTEI